MFNFFGKKREIEEIKNEVQSSFSNVKTDIEKVGKWIEHLNSKHDKHLNEFERIDEDISSLKEEVEQLKEIISMFGGGISKQVFKTNKQPFIKQTNVYSVQTPVQTPVQTARFYGISNLSVTERAIIWMIANSELKLSYEDIASMLGKTTSTIRGHINRIKQKSEGLVEDYIEKNGKKRVYMPEDIKEKIVKNVKVRVQKGEKEGKNSKKRESESSQEE
jgi:DNA-binding CsgD family transcriptional regulator